MLPVRIQDYEHSEHFCTFSLIDNDIQDRSAGRRTSCFITGDDSGPRKSFPDAVGQRRTRCKYKHKQKKAECFAGGGNQIVKYYLNFDFAYLNRRIVSVFAFYFGCEYSI
jgi:hypothetical protein